MTMSQWDEKISFCDESKLYIRTDFYREKVGSTVAMATIDQKL